MRVPASPGLLKSTTIERCGRRHTTRSDDLLNKLSVTTKPQSWQLVLVEAPDVQETSRSLCQLCKDFGQSLFLRRSASSTGGLASVLLRTEGSGTVSKVMRADEDFSRPWRRARAFYHLAEAGNYLPIEALVLTIFLYKSQSVQILFFTLSSASFLPVKTGSCSVPHSS
jgi:hypothetical protein